jgi:hypothetical protein
MGQLTKKLGQHKVDRAAISEANFGNRSSVNHLYCVSKKVNDLFPVCFVENTDSFITFVIGLTV